MLNVQRARRDLPRLRLNRKLSTAARRHSQAMVSGRFFSHDSANGSSFLDRIRRTGYLSGASSWSVGEKRLPKSVKGHLRLPGAMALMEAQGMDAGVERECWQLPGAGGFSGGGGVCFWPDAARS